MRTADIDPATLYAIQARFAGRVPGRVIVASTWHLWGRFNDPNVWTAEKRRPSHLDTPERASYTRPYNGTTQGLPVIVGRTGSVHRDLGETIAAVNAAHEIAARVLAEKPEGISVRELRDAITAGIDEDNSQLIELEMVRPQAVSGEWGPYVERALADHSAEREQRHRELLTRQENERRKVAALALVAEVTGLDDAEVQEQVHTEQRWSGQEHVAAVSWEFLGRLIEAARADGATRASRTIGEFVRDARGVRP